MDFAAIIKALTGGNLGDIEGKAGDLLGRLEKLGADVIGSNGNLVETVVALASDFATMKAALADLTGIVADLKGLHSQMQGTVAALPAIVQVSHAGPAPAVATGGTGAPVSAVSILQAAETIAQRVAPVLQQVASDPFAPRPLSRIAAVVEPHGGA